MKWKQIKDFFIELQLFNIMLKKLKADIKLKETK